MMKHPMSDGHRNNSTNDSTGNDEYTCANSGELLAAFEMFEMGGGEGSALLPALPQEKESQMEGLGPILPVPPEIRPTLVKYR
jgi:hypothetical protein